VSVFIAPFFTSSAINILSWGQNSSASFRLKDQQLFLLKTVIFNTTDFLQYFSPHIYLTLSSFLLMRNTAPASIVLIYPRTSLKRNLLKS